MRNRSGNAATARRTASAREILQTGSIRQELAQGRDQGLGRFLVQTERFR